MIKIQPWKDFNFSNSTALPTDDSSSNELMLVPVDINLGKTCSSYCSSIFLGLAIETDVVFSLVCGSFLQLAFTLFGFHFYPCIGLTGLSLGIFLSSHFFILYWMSRINNRHAIPNSVILVTAISVSVLALESSPINIVSPIVQPCNAFKAGSNICGDKS